MSGERDAGCGEIALRRIGRGEISVARADAVDAATIEIARGILEDVRREGFEGVLRHGRALGDLAMGADGDGGEGGVIVEGAALERAIDAIDREDRRVLEEAAQRIRAFATAQRRSLVDLEMPAASGGTMGHRVVPVMRAGCYAPGGRFPLPSSVLMTAVTARAAGVREVWVASPRPSPATLAAAAIAGADAVLAVGGAQAIGAFAYGAGRVPRCDAIVGPGNRFVTAAKQLVSGRVAIDMLAGPSELLIVADASADPAIVAADLLAQAEHDPDAIPMLVTTDATLPGRVDRELSRQLASLPTAGIARRALGNGFACVVGSMEEAVLASDEIAPEHLEILVENGEREATRFVNYGAIFVGSGAAEVFGDYGIGPNHTLPTGGTARSFAGLSVLTFLKARTFISSAVPGAEGRVARDVARFARMEGLEAHARAAERRA